MRLSNEQVQNTLDKQVDYILIDVTMYCYCQGKGTYFFERFIAENTAENLHRLKLVTKQERFSIDTILFEKINYDEAATLYKLGAASVIDKGVEYYDVYSDEVLDDDEVELLDEDQVWKVA